MAAYVYDFSVSSSCCALTRPGGEVEAGSREQSPPTTTPAVVAATIANTHTGAAGSRDAGTNASTGEATAEISSEPLGADIEIDGNFVSNTPSSIGLAAGEHVLRISNRGYKPWERTLKSSTGKINVTAELEPLLINAPASSIPPIEVAPIRNPDPPAYSADGKAGEVRIGIWFAGNPTAKHNGLEISGVQPNGPADIIDIKPGDVIISIDGHFLYTVDELRAELRRHEDGARLAIRYRHDRLTYDNYLSLSPKGSALLR